MSVTKTEIFLSSRFEEFAALRTHLCRLIRDFPVFPLEAIDFNDGRVSERPPLENCVDAVKRSEIMILLVGETYGEPPKGQNHSYTHLEYKAAIAPDSQVEVLPFFIGPSYKQKAAILSSHLRMAEWQKEILDNHTPGFYDDDIDSADLARMIFDWSLKTLYEARSREIRGQIDSYLSEGGETLPAEMSGLDLDELNFLQGRAEEGRAQRDSGTLKPWESVLEIVANPSRAAAEEQIREAQDALEFGDRAVVIHHYRRALEHSPGSFIANYNLARILVSSSRKSDIRQSVRMALKAVRISEVQGKDVQVAASYILAAQGSAKLNDLEQGLKLALAACEKAPGLAAAYFELACQYARRQDIENVFKAVDEVFKKHLPSFFKLDGEPVIRELGEPYLAYRKKLLNRLRRAAITIIENEEELSNKLFYKSCMGTEKSGALAKIESASFLEVIRLGRISANRNLEILQMFPDEIKRSHSEIQRAKSKASNLIKEPFPLADAQNTLESEIVKSQNKETLLKVASCLLAVWAVGAFLLKGVSISPLLAVVLLVSASFYFLKTKKITKELELVKTQFSNGFSDVKNQLGQFKDSIRNFEESVLPHRIFSPGKRLRQDKNQDGDLILLDTKYINNYDWVRFDLSLMPETFEFFPEKGEDFTSRFVLCRYDKNDSILRRWESYWD